MANCSDAFGTITIDKVGNEFVEFLKSVQGSESSAYYKLAEVYEFDDIVPDSDGDVEFDFSTMGRWNYGSNIDGYLKGEWMNEDADKEAYSKFVSAMKEKGGSVTISYTDSDPSNDWMGTGEFKMLVEGGEVVFHDNFNAENVTVSKFADLNGYNEYEALEYLYGEDVTAAYDKYEEECKAEGKEVLDPAKWYENIYEEE